MAARPPLSPDRRQQIVAVAIDVIVQRGLSETRLSDIASRAGVSPALLLYYFGSKERLLSEALTFVEDRFHLRGFRELLDVPSPVDQLVRLIALSAFEEGESDRSHWTLWMELWVRALRDPDAARLRQALDRRWRSMIVDVVKAGQASGAFAPVDAEEFAVALAALFDGLAIQVVLEDPAVTPDLLHRRCLDYATRELGFTAPVEQPAPAGEPAATPS